MNETLLDYCRQRGVEFTRCRPWRRNDQALVEEKNCSIVRRIVGYCRLEGLDAAAALTRLDATVRLFVNFLQPSFKLAAKAREEATIRKPYYPPATSSQRLLADPRMPHAMWVALCRQRAMLDPVLLLQQLRQGQQEISGLTDGGPSTHPASAEAPSLDAFLATLRMAWKEGEVRPTARPKPQPKRSRRRLDSLEKATDEL